MKVHFYGSVQKYGGGESVEVGQVETIGLLIEELGYKIGADFKEYLLGENCFFLVNGRAILGTGGLNTKVSLGDKIEILPVVEAG